MARRFRHSVLLAFMLAATAGFLALGVWQVQRLAWKTELIAQVDRRVHAAPTPAPLPASRVTRETDAYRAVWVKGRFQNDKETLVKAVTDLGPGYWVLTPLRSDAGFTVLVNRGFVPATRVSNGSGHWARPAGDVRIAGLLRLTEPKGGFLRTNAPATGRWYSRDVAAIATARGVQGPTASYFIDAARDGAQGWPRGGLTVVRFTNNHLVYAVTWFILAAMGLFAMRYVLSVDKRRSSDRGQPNDQR